MIDVRAIWEELMREQSHRTVYRQLNEVTSAKCYLGYTPQTGTRFVQLDVPARVAKHAATVRRTQAIRLDRVNASDQEHVIVLLLQEPGLTDVFSLFIDDLLQHLVLTQDADRAATALYSRLNIGSSSSLESHRMSSAWKGNEVCSGNLSSSRNSWITMRILQRSGMLAGPFSANHDFSMSGTALEVKTSVASSPQSCTSVTRCNSTSSDGKQLCFVWSTSTRSAVAPKH